MTRLTFNKVQQLATEASYSLEKLTRGYILFLEMNDTFIEHDKFNTLAEVVEAINNGVLLCGSQCLLPIVEPSFTPEHEQLVDNEPSVSRSWGQDWIDVSLTEQEVEYLDRIVEDYQVTEAANAWTRQRQHAGYCVGFAEITKRTPRRVQRRANRLTSYLAA